MMDNLEFKDIEIPTFTEEEVRSYGKLLPANPIRPVDWRFKLANFCLNRKEYKPECDQAFEEIFKFVRQLNKILLGQNDKSLVKLSQNYPGLYWAWILFSDNFYDRTRTELNSRILAKENPDQVIRKIGITIDIYDWYKLAFFDVETRLDNPGFIINQVILNGDKYFNVDSEEVLLPLLGYMLGVEAVDYCVYRMQKMNMNSFLDNVEGEIKNRLKVKLWAAVQAGNIEKSEAILNLLQKLLGKDKADPSESLINLLQSAFGSKP
jgi:hypothetical protein